MKLHPENLVIPFKNLVKKKEVEIDLFKFLCSPDSWKLHANP